MGLKLSRRLPLVLAIPTLALLLTACQSQQSLFLGRDISDNGSIDVGVKTDQPGTGWLADHYDYSGFDVDVAQAVGDSLGFRRSFVPVSSPHRETALTNDDADHVDLVIATFSIEKARAKQVYMAGPYAKTYQGFMVRKGDTRIKKLSDLNGKSVCAWDGANSLGILKAEVPKVVPKPAPDAQTCVSMLRQGTIDAVSTDQMILYGFAQHDSHLQVIPDLVIGSANYYGVAMAKKDLHGESNLADCIRIRDALKKFIDSSVWNDDMSKDLPQFVADPQWSVYDRPTVADIDELSCRDDFDE